MTERMFRSRMLKIVVATATLAVGIHMPCRTVVFPKASHFLRAMSFHQMSGRAGRRGYDFVGNVVFANFDFPKMKQLISHNTVPLSSLQRLDGTSILQLIHLAHSDPLRASNAITGTLHNFLGGTEALDQTNNSCHLSLRIFAKLGLVRQSPPRVECTALSAGATRLNQFAPNNFYLLKILLCDALDDSQAPMTDEELLLLLCLACTSCHKSESRPLPGSLEKSFPQLSPKIASLINHMNSEVMFEIADVIEQTRQSSTSRATSVSRFFDESFQEVKEDVFRLSHRFSPSTFVTVPQERTQPTRLSGQQNSHRSIFNSNFEVLETACMEVFGMGLESLPLFILSPTLETHALYSFVTRPLPETDEEDDVKRRSEVLLKTIHEESRLVGSEIGQMVTNFCKFLEKLRLGLISLEKSYPKYFPKIASFNQQMETLNLTVHMRASSLSIKDVSSVQDLRKRFNNFSIQRSPFSRSSTKQGPLKAPSSPAPSPAPASSTTTTPASAPAPARAPVRASAPKSTIRSPSGKLKQNQAKPVPKPSPPPPAKDARSTNFWDAIATEDEPVEDDPSPATLKSENVPAKQKIEAAPKQQPPKKRGKGKAPE
jgi:hypothetical protein